MVTTFQKRNPRLTQWSLFLQPFNFTVQHRKGQANATADALSRLDSLHFVQEKEGGNVMDSLEGHGTVWNRLEQIGTV